MIQTMINKHGDLEMDREDTDHGNLPIDGIEEHYGVFLLTTDKQGENNEQI